MSAVAEAFDGDRRRQRDFLYAVLDLPVFATEVEIKERHRALSLIFHPDKQHDERKKELAKERFLEIQAAYEVLSDPFLREVYDTLGYDGLKIDFPIRTRELPQYELRQALREYFYESRMTRLQSQINSRGTMTCSLDARELFYDGWLAREWITDLSERIAATKLSVLSLRHSFSKRIGQQTTLQVISRLGQAGIEEEDVEPLGAAKRFSLLRGNVLGVITHQYSPAKQLQVKASLTNLRGVILSWAHEEKLNYFGISAPLRPTLAPPPITLSFRRRLFRDTLTLGALDCVLQPGSGEPPAVNITLSKPAVSIANSWFASGWKWGLNLRARSGPAVFTQWQALCNALSTLFAVGLEYNLFTGLAGTLEGEWSSEGGEADVLATVVWDMRGVVLRMTFTYLGQTVVLPIILADEYAPGLAFLAALVPASAFALADYFVLRSLRAAKREKRLADHRRAQKDHFSEKRSEAEAVAAMLKDTARRSLQAEKDSDGLVVLEASYFPLEDNGVSMNNLGLDVTIPVQALVHNGQLFIPGGRSKSVLRGFYDPLPECTKRLSVRYEFRDRQHYVEVGEYAPVVLPLESHLVEHNAQYDGTSKP